MENVTNNNIRGQLVIYLVAIAALFIILGGIRSAASIINPILLAIVLTITVLPVPSRLKRRGMPGWLALVLSILLVVGILLLVMLTVFFSMTKLSTEMTTYMASMSAQATSDMSATVDSSTTIQVDSIVTSIGTFGASMFSAVAGFLAQFGLALVIFCFMIAAAISMPTPSRLGLDPDTPVIGRIAALTGDVRKYMTVLTGINLMVGMGDMVFLLIIGVDYAFLWGLLAWFMGYIPSIGFIVALIPPALMAYAQFGLQTALIVVVGYILINGGVQNIIQPKIMGTNLRISPVIVFIMVFVWGYMLGGMGAILAVPMTLLMLVIMENFESTRFVAVLMRYTGEVDQDERKEAEKQAKGVLGKMKSAIKPNHESKDKKG